MYVEAAPHERPVSIVDAPDRAAARWAAETLQVMDDLDSVDRAALQLIYSFGMSQAQVAWELGLPETEIRRSVARGMCEVAARLTMGAASPARPIPSTRPQLSEPGNRTPAAASS